MTDAAQILRAKATRELLVLHDLTPQADHAAWRAGMIARDLGASLCILHASADAMQLPRQKLALERLLARLARTLRIDVDLRMVQGDPAAAVMRSAAGLVVLGTQRINVLRQWLFGSPIERLIRLCRRPVLVVKNPPADGYSRVLVPVVFGPAASAAVAAAATLTPASDIEVFHALQVRAESDRRAADVPEAVMHQHRQRRADRAHRWIAELIRKVPGASAVPSIGFGHAASAVLARQQAMRADLVVIGKRQRGLLADFLLGGVTQRLLAAGRSDVLVLPEPRRAAPDHLLAG